MTRFLKWLLPCLLVGGLTPVYVSAFQFSPLSQEIVLDRVRPSVNYTVQNTTESPIAVQIRAFTREIDPDGSEVNEPVGDTIHIYPSQMILRPGDIQVVRVRWSGSTDIERGRAYRIVAEQVPVDLDQEEQEGSTLLRMVLRYSSTLFVQPPEAEPELTVLSVVPANDSDQSYLVTIRNDGTGYARLDEGVLVLYYRGLQEEIPWTEIEEVAGHTIPPGVVREFTVSGIPFTPEGGRVSSGG